MSSGGAGVSGALTSRAKSVSRPGARRAAGNDALRRAQSAKGRFAQPVDSIVHLLLQTNQLPKLLYLVRQRSVSASEFATALAAGRRPDVLNALRAPVAPFNTTVAHELARVGRPAHVAWLCTEVPELLHAREPLGNATVLHTIAIERDDNDVRELIDMLWARVNVKLLMQTDRAGCTPAHYLAIKRAFGALEVVNRRVDSGAMQRVASAHNSETPSALAMTQMARVLDSAQRENARLLHNMRVAESTAEELKAMHVELDHAIAKRDADLERRDAEIVAMRERVSAAVGECEALRARQQSLDAESGALAAELERSQAEAQATRQRATDAERHVEALQRTLCDGDKEADELVLERDELQTRLRAKELELAAARDNSDAHADVLADERDALLREQEELGARVAANEAERAQLAAQLDAARDERERLSNELTESQSRLSAASLDAERLRAKSAALEHTLAERSEQLSALARERDELRAEASRATEQAERATAAARQHAEALRAVRNSEEADGTLIEETERAIEAAERELSAAREREAALRADAERRDAATRESMDALEAQLGARTAEIDELRAQLRESVARADDEARQRNEAMARIEAERAAAAAAARTETLAVPADGGTLRRARTRTLGRAPAAGVLSTPRRYASLKRERANSTDSSTTSDASRVGTKEAALRAAVRDNALRNAKLNRVFFNRLFDAVRNGDVPLVTRYIELGISVNTRSAVSGDDAASGNQTLLEVAVHAARDANCSSKMMGEKESRALIDALTRIVRTLLEAGADWLGLDDYMVSVGCDLPPKINKLLRMRDDSSPFCQALLANNEERALLFVDMVEDFSRVPSKHKSDAMSYLHLAVANGHARLTQRMLGTGNCAPNAHDGKDRTPLHIALQKISDSGKRRLVVECLLAAGAHPGAQSTYTKLKDRARRSALGKSSASGASASKAAAQTITPVALAEAIGDSVLVSMMRDVRYLRVTVDEEVAKECGAPLLQTYISSWVELHVTMERLLASGEVLDTSPLYRVYQRYCDVFGCFNRNLHGRVGYKLVLERIYAEAGVDDRYAVDDETACAALERMVAQDEAVLAEHMSASSGARDKAQGNSSFVWNVCKLLTMCTKAVTGRFFEVDRMIEEPACALYDTAVRIALADFVRTDKVAEIDWLVNRNDSLFGDLSLDSIVDESLNLTGMELAAHVGKVNALEYFMERQRGRIDAANADGRTLVMIALTGCQPISIVAIDHFKWNARMSAVPHANAEHYGLLTRKMRNSVLHQCINSIRPDLLRFCANKVAFQLERKNDANQTPIELARTRMTFQQRGAETLQKYEECIGIVERRIAGASDSESSENAQGAAPPDSAALVSDISSAVRAAAKEALVEAAATTTTTPTSAEAETPRTRERRRKHRSSRSHRRSAADARAPSGKESSRRTSRSRKSKQRAKEGEESGGGDDDDDDDAPALPPPPPLQAPPALS